MKSKFKIPLIVAVLLSLVFYLINALNLNGMAEVDILYLSQFAVSGCVKPEIESILDGIIIIIPVFIFVFLYIQYIYKDLTTTGIYYLIRYKRRDKWYLKKSLTLLAESLLFFTTFFLVGFIINLAFGFSVNNLLQLLCLISSQILVYSLFSFITVLLINIVSMILGSTWGVVLIIAGLVICYYDVFAFTNGNYNLSFNLNPITNLVTDWHTFGNIGILPSVLNIETPIWFSFVYLIAISLVVELIGYLIIKNIDITLKDMS